MQILELFANYHDLHIWTWIDLFWNILVKVKRTICAAFNSRIFMYMSDSCLLHGPRLALPCIMLPNPFLMHQFEKSFVPNDVLLFCYLISSGCLLTVSALPQNLNSDALKFGGSISTLMPVFVVPEDNPLGRKLLALPLLLNIGFLLDLLFSRGSQIHSGESPGTILWNPELFPVLKWISFYDWRIVCFMLIHYKSYILQQKNRGTGLSGA